MRLSGVRIMMLQSLSISFRTDDDVLRNTRQGKVRTAEQWKTQISRMFGRNLTAISTTRHYYD